MFQKVSSRWVLMVLLLSVGTALAADPTLQQVYEAARTGHLAQAQQMMSQVLHDHPDSAKAHYVAAEIDARAGNYPLARQELSTAEQLAPGLPFVNQESVRALKRELAGPSTARSTVPWGWILLLAGGGLLLWLLFRPRPAAVYPQYPGVTPSVGTGGPMGPGPVMPPGVGGTGSGLLGSLGTGLAVGAGVAAGEELVRHMLEPGSHRGGVIPSAGAEEARHPQNADMGGNDFGVSDPGSWDDGLTGGDIGGGGGDDWT